MNLDVVFEKLLDKMALLERVVVQQGVQLNNIFREATVKEVDYSKGKAIVEAHGIETKEIPWLEQAGDIVEWNPPTAGQRVMLVSPGGDLGRAFIMPGGFTDNVGAPHDKGAEKRVKIGSAVITHSAAGLFIEIDGVTFAFTGEGFVQTGGKQEHDARNVGSTHVHDGILPGPADTGLPH